MEQFKNNIAKLFFKIGLTANAATVLGLICAFVAGYMAYLGVFILAGAFLLISGFFDLMDGAIARLSGKATSFGGILDSCLDRYGDAFILSGILFYAADHGRHLWMLLSMSALAGSFLVSYVRARAECVIPKCKVGFWERGERVVYLALGLLFGNVALVLLVLAVGTHLTAFYRMGYAYKAVHDGQVSAGGRAAGGQSFLFHSQGRLHPYYWTKVVFLVALALFLRPLF